jgi:mono/diheme cytochrome c family protein
VRTRTLLGSWLAAAALAATLACAGALRRPGASDADAVASDWPGTTAADLARGRALYVRRCSACHTLVVPSAYPPEAWPALVQAMAERARLSPPQQQDVARLLVALARTEPEREARRR